VEGNFLILSDGSSINVNIWIKQGAIDQIMQSLNQQQGGSSSGPSGNRGKGGYRGSRGGSRGGFQRGGGY
jgi:hypothetical protein